MKVGQITIGNKWYSNSVYSTTEKIVKNKEQSKKSLQSTSSNKKVSLSQLNNQDSFLLDTRKEQKRLAEEMFLAELTKDPKRLLLNQPSQELVDIVVQDKHSTLKRGWRQLPVQLRDGSQWPDGVHR